MFTERVHWVVGPVRELPKVAARLRWRKFLGWETPFVRAEAHRRTKPSEVFPTAKSMLVVAVPYYHPVELAVANDDEILGRISRSAWGEDYHRVVPKLVFDLVCDIADRGCAERAYIQVDAGPLEERAFALDMGLGYRCYNAAVAVPQIGTWNFLGIALLDEDIPAQRSHRTAEPVQQCMECNACVQACPTGAIVAPYRVNPYRCISYLTQKKGFFARSLRRAMDDHLFGCDICQECCPENEEVATGLSAFAPDCRDLGADVWDILKMTKSDFDETWKHKSSGWRGRRTLQRNALIILGNRGSREHLARLAEYLRDLRPVIRGHAAWAIGEIARRFGISPASRVKRALERIASDDDNVQVRREAELAASI